MIDDPDDCAPEYEKEIAMQAAEIERLRAALSLMVGYADLHNDEGPPGGKWRSNKMHSEIEAARKLLNQQPVSLAEMQQPEERRKNAEAKDRLDAISGHQQSPQLPPAGLDPLFNRRHKDTP